jgi:hypothetical protein
LADLQLLKAIVSQLCWPISSAVMWLVGNVGPSSESLVADAPGCYLIASLMLNSKDA